VREVVARPSPCGRILDLSERTEHLAAHRVVAALSDDISDADVTTSVVDPDTEGALEGCGRRALDIDHIADEGQFHELGARGQRDAS
jgi:hypothetical protein